ncbi:uncharacterized protein LOC132622259 isoform X2 [Lycium barbarum]|uniref:uncharacterized protein LOC132622259 isoform X2 n=1 Tax=Lycium barbarum TaxID=112863 RepID=UPI00293F1B60|nr:uncharacterized protein LOC132622259 isoform X2 [Lycium barbarum]
MVEMHILGELRIIYAPINSNQKMNTQEKPVEEETTTTGDKEEDSSSAVMSAAASATDGVAAAALRSVIQRIQHAAARPDQVRLVAVSKTKPVSLLKQVYDAGHRCFGENYVKELVEKAPQIANQLNRVAGDIGRKPLKVFIQVNTSGEETKSGVEPDGCVELVKHVTSNCPNLEFCGLMTIGMPDYTSTPENFKTLARCRSEVCKALGISEDQCELSMGMSGDFELAVEMGSTNVRVGSTIFGAREYPKKQLN